MTAPLEHPLPLTRSLLVVFSSSNSILIFLWPSLALPSTIAMAGRPLNRLADEPKPLVCRLVQW
jgi:hypothetical protein